MAALDKLFDVMLRHEMEALLLDPAQVPRFLKEEKHHRAAKTVLEGPLIQQLLNELSPDAGLDDIGVAGESRRFVYAWNGTELGIEANWTEEGWSAVVAKVGAEAPEQEPDLPEGVMAPWEDPPEAQRAAAAGSSTKAEATTASMPIQTPTETAAVGAAVATAGGSAVGTTGSAAVATALAPTPESPSGGPSPAPPSAEQMAAQLGLTPPAPATIADPPSPFDSPGQAPAASGAPVASSAPAASPARAASPAPAPTGRTPKASPTAKPVSAAPRPAERPQATVPTPPVVRRPEVAKPKEDTPEAEAESTAEVTSEAPPVRASEVQNLDHLLELMLSRGASDLHLSATQVPRVRIHGELAPLAEFKAPDSDELQKLLAQITPKEVQDHFAATNDSDFAYELEGHGRFRVNLFRDHRGAGAVLREIPFEIPSFEQLSLPEVLRSISHLSKGLVLVTGPTGSGKSTTLAALIDMINRSRADHIITIEDPVEFVHPSKKCLVNQREVGTHTKSFSAALRAALREDPDIVLIGEMRDLETTSMAIETAETGHLVFGTLHTTTAASTVERLIDQFPADRQGQIRTMLSQSLHAVVAQMLLKKIGGGRVAAFEILLATPAVSNLIREGKTFQIPSAMQTGKRQGMTLLNDSLLHLVKTEQVEPFEAYLKAADKEELVNKMRGEGIDFDPVKAAQEEES